MTYPTMTATIADRSADRVTLDIEHDPAQSWSRAVDPCAMRKARTVLPRDGRQWAMTDADYSRPDAPTGRSVSRYTFEATR